MKLEIVATSGKDAEAAFAIVPANGFTLIKGKGPAAELFDVSTTYQTVGTVPATVQFTCMFDFRPWSITVAAHAGDATGTASLSSEAIGLDPKPLITPDVLTVELTYTAAGTKSAPI